MKRKYYALFHCDEWKTYSSMRFIGVVSESRLKWALNKIKHECEYDKDELDTYVFIKEIEINDLDV